MSDLVYVTDKTFCWLPARVISMDETSATVSVRLPEQWSQKTEHGGKAVDGEKRRVRLKEYPENKLPRQNVDRRGVVIGKPDMADLFFLHEAAILYNLKDRHFKGLPYTRVGDITIAVNPYKWISDLYSEEKKAFYAKNYIWETENIDEKKTTKTEPSLDESMTPLMHPPHVYETSSLAFKRLAVDKVDQSILVSGDSGAGKTETVKLVMSYLASIQSIRPNRPKHSIKSSKNAFVDKIMQSNPLFEAFGNAKTVRNNNSSRFGKFTELKFSVEKNNESSNENGAIPNCTLIGSNFETYLLEKARIAVPDDGERTYHIFYQLLAAPEEDKRQIWEGLSNTSLSSFFYFGESEHEIIGGDSDKDKWFETVKASNLFGIKGDSFRHLMQAVCIVLQLGNLRFGPDPENPETSTIIANSDELHRLSDLLGIDVDEDMLASALTRRRVKTTFDEIQYALIPSVAKEGCDALAKEIYTRLFFFLVNRINSETNNDEVTDPTAKSCKISLLDIFGFESFHTNRFAQLCINYANERLQQKYVTDVFIDVQTEYIKEGIEVFDFKLVDNTDIVELIDGKFGLLTVLNEECLLPKGSNKSFVYKLKAVNKHSKYLIKNKLNSPHEFEVSHFAGNVKYDASKFIDRNVDLLPPDLVDVAAKCSNSIVKVEFSKLLSEGSGKKSSRKKSSTVSSKFKLQMNQLLKSIEHSKTRYIRCIKPNAQYLPQITDHQMTMHQLSCVGIVTAITISKETFPNQLVYDVFINRFSQLTCFEFNDEDDKTKADKILSSLLADRERVVGGKALLPYSCGKTKVFFRSGALEALEQLLLKKYTDAVIPLQAWFRRKIALRKYELLVKCTLWLQNRMRTKIQRKWYIKTRRKIVIVQSQYQVYLAKKKLQKRRKEKAIVLIQTRWRIKQNTTYKSRMKDAALIIQRAVRNRRNKGNFEASMVKLVKQAKKDNEMKIFLSTCELSKQNKNVSKSKNELLDEACSIIRFFSNEAMQLRTEVSDLRAGLRDQEEATSSLQAHSNRLKAASAANKFEVDIALKANERVAKDLQREREANAWLKQQMREMQQSHLRELEELRAGKRDLEFESERRVEACQRSLREARKTYTSDLNILKKSMRSKEKAHLAEVSALKEELRKVLTEHNEDLARMFEALEMNDDNEDEAIEAVDRFTRESKENSIDSLRKSMAFMREQYTAMYRFSDK